MSSVALVMIGVWPSWEHHDAVNEVLKEYDSVIDKDNNWMPIGVPWWTKGWSWCIWWYINYFDEELMTRLLKGYPVLDDEYCYIFVRYDDREAKVILPHSIKFDLGR
jgi:hypothetical protein